MNNEELKSNLLSATHWIRLVYMVLFALVLQVAGTVMYFVVTVQFVYSLVTGKNHEILRNFGGNLSTFIYQTLQFLSYNSEEKPFPFSDWPAIVEGSASIGESETVNQSKSKPSPPLKANPKAKPKAKSSAAVKSKAKSKSKDTVKAKPVKKPVKKSVNESQSKTASNADEVAEAKDFIQQEDA